MDDNMLVIAGGIGLGLVWGWLAARLIYRGGWRATLLALGGLLAQGLISVYLASALATVGAGAAAGVSALVCYGWLRSLERRRVLSAP